MALSDEFPGDSPPPPRVARTRQPEDGASDLDFRSHARIAGDFTCPFCDQQTDGAAIAAD